jgi:hypothetical protein
MFTFKNYKTVRNLKISLLTAVIIGFVSLIGCTKKTTTTIITPDSVYSSGWLSFSMTLQTDQNNDSAYVTTFSNSKITPAVVNSGVVLSYLGFASTSGTTTDTVGEQALEYDVLTNFQVGSIDIESFPFDQGGFGDISTSISGLYYRYVIVPGSVLAASGLNKQQWKSLNFAEATKLIQSATRSASSPGLSTP